jgi:hypothetical protein
MNALARSETPELNEKPESVMMKALPCGAMMSFDSAVILIAAGETVTFTRALLLFKSEEVFTPTYSKASWPENLLLGMQKNVLAFFCEFTLE